MKDVATSALPWLLLLTCSLHLNKILYSSFCVTSSLSRLSFAHTWTMSDHRYIPFYWDRYCYLRIHSAVRDCLGVPELSSTIISHIPYGKDLVSMTVVNQFLSNIALDRIWGRLHNYVPLVLAFPKIAPADEDKENSEVCSGYTCALYLYWHSFCNSKTYVEERYSSPEWIRFLSYARRVKVIED